VSTLHDPWLYSSWGYVTPASTLYEPWLSSDWWYAAPALRLNVYPTSVADVEPAPNLESIIVDLIPLTNKRVTVSIEGVNTRQELVFNDTKTKQTIYLPPGVHKLCFKNTLDNPWICGSLNLGRTDRIRIAFNQDKKLVQVYDDPKAWIEDRDSLN
jgi:hypothetical protein